MMYQWTADMIRFMEDASFYTDYFSKLCNLIMPYLSGCKNIIDAGCGLGQLSCEFGKMGLQVYACDLSESAIDYVKQADFKNVTAVHCNLENWTPPVKPDAVVFNYFGNNDQVLNIAEKLGAKKAVIIKKNYTNHRFSLQQHALEGRENIENIFEKNKIEYEKKEISLEFGQPFRNKEDALLFFNIYSRDSDRSIITFENISKRLEKANSEEYEYYLPQRKDSIVYLVKR